MKIQTPQAAYNALISRLELFSNFQTMVTDLTILPMSNTSLLNEGIATMDSMLM
jgi:glycine dehydrogenase